MDTEWSSNRIPELVRLQLVLPRKDFDPVYLLEDSLDRNIQPERKTIYIDTAELRRQRLLAEDPQVSASSRHLDQSLDTILKQLPSQQPQVTVSILVVAVDRHPLRALRLWVDGIEPNRQLAARG